MIEVSHAAIHTDQVELKMITVNQRQMTLSVFRQIPQKRLIDSETLKLNGVPWGWVNYFWPGLDMPVPPPKRAVQVVWQKGTVLYRDIVYAIPERFGAELRQSFTSGCTKWKGFIPSCIKKAVEVWGIEYQTAIKDFQRLDFQRLLDSLQNRQSTKKEQAAAATVDALIAQYNQVVTGLMAMDQLYIAVGGGGKSR